MLIGTCALLPLDNQFLGLACKKGRGIILPGGLWEAPELYSQCAKREFNEETGMVAVADQFLFFGIHYDPARQEHCANYAFQVRVAKFDYNCLGVDFGAGVVSLYHADDFRTSAFGPYYELLFSEYYRRRTLEEARNSGL